MDGAAEQARKFVVDQILKNVWTYIILPVLAFIGASVWAHMQGMPGPTIAMVALAGCPLCSFMLLGTIWLYKELTNKRAELAIEYDPRRHHAVSDDGFAVTRFLIRNTNRKNPAKNLVVLIDSLVDITSESAHPQASWFINVPIKLERADLDSGVVILKPLRTVEAFGPKAPKNSDQFFFPSPDPGASKSGAFNSAATRYRMTVFVSADNADPEYEQFILFARDGVMQMLRESDPEAQREMLRPAAPRSAVPASPIDPFVGEWRMIPEKGEPAFLLTLDRSMRATKSHVPDAVGTWEVVGNEARVTWSDQWKDRLRVQNGEMFKLAFRPATNWNDAPSNTQRATRES